MQLQAVNRSLEVGKGDLERRLQRAKLVYSRELSRGELAELYAILEPATRVRRTWGRQQSAASCTQGWAALSSARAATTPVAASVTLSPGSQQRSGARAGCRPALTNHIRHAGRAAMHVPSPPACAHTRQAAQVGEKQDRGYWVDALGKRNEDYGRLLERHKQCQAERSGFSAMAQGLQKRVSELEVQLQELQARPCPAFLKWLASTVACRHWHGCAACILLHAPAVICDALQSSTMPHRGNEPVPAPGSQHACRPGLLAAGTPMAASVVLPLHQQSIHFSPAALTAPAAQEANPPPAKQRCLSSSHKRAAAAFTWETPPQLVRSPPLQCRAKSSPVLGVDGTWMAHAVWAVKACRRPGEMPISVFWLVPMLVKSPPTSGGCQLQQ